MRGWIEITVRDKHGRVIQHGKHEMRSFVNNFLKLFAGMLSAPGNTPTAMGYYGVYASTSVIDPTGATQTIYIEWYGNANAAGGGVVCAAKAPGSDDSYGIVVGSGSTTLTLDQYTLATKISHGTGSGQLSYGISTFDDLGLDMTVSPPVYRFRLLRTFTNNTSAPININEVGIIGRSYWKFTSVAQDIKYMISRDVLPTTYTVPAGGTATVAITIEVEVG